MKIEEPKVTQTDYTIESEDMSEDRGSVDKVAFFFSLVIVVVIIVAFIV